MTYPLNTFINTKYFDIYPSTLYLRTMGKQLQFEKHGFKKEKSDHGGIIKNPQKRKRPLGVKSSMHLVLKSEKATGSWSLKRYKSEIHQILQNFSQRYDVEMISYANVGNHLHLHIKVGQRKAYHAFIRAISAAIAIKVTGYCRWKKAPKGFKFWDYRPFSRIISTWKEYLTLKKYINVNQWQGLGKNKLTARELVAKGILAPTNTC